MNKLFTKIAGLSLGLAMAIGVGVAVAAGDSKEASPVYAAAGDTFSLASSIAANDEITFVGKNSSNYYSSAAQANNNRSGVAVTYSNSKITAVATTSIFKVEADANNDGYWNFKDTSTNQYLYNASSSSKSYLRSNGTVNADTFRWSVSISNGVATISSKSTNRPNMRFNYNNGSPLFNCYATGQSDVYIYKKDAAKTLSSISVSTSHRSFTVGDTFVKETVTAHYSDSSSATVTNTASFTGYNMSSAGNQTVTVSYSDSYGSASTTYSITVAAATTPTISLSGSSFSGYTGQNFSVTATYSNLNSAFAWSTSGSGTTTETITSTGSSTDGTSTYSGTLTGAGTKTITASGGGASSQTYTVDITKTTVDITKTSTSISAGKSETLAASHNASSVGGLNWTSSDNTIATVESDGKVTVAGGATVGDTVTITATSSVDTSVFDTCTVTVAAAPASDVITLATTGVTSTSYASGDFSGKSATNSGHTSAVYAGQVVKSSNGYIQMRATNPGGIVSTGSGGKVRGVTVTWDTAAMAANARSLDVYCNTSAYSSGADLYSTSTDGDKVGSISYTNTTTYQTYLSISGDYTYIGLRSYNGAMYIQEIDIDWELPNALDHVTVSFASDPADRTFYAGSNFAFNGTLTASYTADSPKAVTPASYHLNSEGGTAITTSTVLTVSDHNGKSVYVVYTEGGVTKSDSFTLIVNAAPATSVTLSSSSGSVALSPEEFEVSSVTATVEPSAYAVQGVTWEVFDSDGLVLNSTYFFNGSIFRATQPADAVIFHVKANSNASIYATFTLTVTGDPIAHLLDGELVDVTDGSTSVFADVGTLSYAVTTENFEGTMSYTWATSNSSVISIDDDQGDICDFYVEGVADSARLSCRIRGSTKGDVTVYIDVTVSAVTVTSVTWNAPTINVYSGATLSTTGWNVRYSTNSGKTDVSADSFDILLGGSVVSSGYEFAAADDGKVLAVRVGNTVSETSTIVSVTQTLRPIMANETNSWDYSFESKQWSAKGEWTLDEELWTMSGTDDGTPYFGYDATKGQQFGSGSHPFSDVSLQSSAFSGTIDSVTVYTSGANSINATVQVSVGGTAYGSAETITNANTAYTFDLGGKSGTISIDWVNSSAKAIYVKQIVVATATGSHDIANAVGHEAAQKAVVKFAKAFNAALDTTEYCTTGLSSAWSTASSAWNTFLSEAATLGETEEAYAKSLIKNATAQWTDDTDENYEYCLERALATYEKCVTVHGQTKFMDDVRSVGRISINPLQASAKSTGTVIAIVIISTLSLAAVGGYFLFRKKKEN